jgi:hypothetical protein
MKYILGKKILGRYFIQDSSEKEIYSCKRKFPLFWRRKFVEKDGKTIFDIGGRITSNYFSTIIKKENQIYARVKWEGIYDGMLGIFKGLGSMGSGKPVNSQKMGTIEKSDGEKIEIFMDVLLGMSNIGTMKIEFKKNGKVIASAERNTKVSLTKLYNVDLDERQDFQLLLAVLILMEIRLESFKEKSQSKLERKLRSKS